MTNLSKLDLFLANKLRFFREHLDWPLKKVAAELGLSLQQVQRYEQGSNKISASLLYELSKIFKTDINAFFEGFHEEDHKNESNDFNILLVEDNPHDVFLFRQAISGFDRKVSLYVLQDGEEALSFFQSKTNDFVPHIIFLDLHLPGFSGFDILKNIKNRHVLRDIPVIILTTSINDDDVKRTYSLQGSGFLKKSFQFEEFKQQLLQALEYWAKAVKLPAA